LNAIEGKGAPVIIDRIGDAKGQVSFFNISYEYFELGYRKIKSST
jgi:hypothetical protein